MMSASPVHIKLEETFLNDLEKSSQSFLMQDIFNKILTLAKLDSNVVIVGEIGSGKKRLAHVIHENSRRANKPFYNFYCIDIDETKYKDAFWGHLQFDEEGISIRYDAIEKSACGVLYLDQFSELSPNLMRDIITSYIKGTNQLFHYAPLNKPRLILSINQESYHNILHSQIWKMLLEKLDPVVIMLPPLRERKDDIPVLINYFLQELRQKGKEWKDVKISHEALCECFNYSWPGNIRQLKNAIMQGAVLSFGQTIESHHLPFSMHWKLPYKIDEHDKS